MTRCNFFVVLWIGPVLEISDDEYEGIGEDFNLSQNKRSRRADELYFTAKDGTENMMAVSYDI